MKTEKAIEPKPSTPAAAAVKAGELKLIPRNQIRPSATNPRKQFDPAKLTELAATITRLGIQQPLLVRFVPQKYTVHKPDLIEKEWTVLDAAGKEVHRSKLEAVVRGWVGDKGEPYYELIAGERRWRAAGEAKLEKVPAIVAELTDAEVIEFQYIENMQREDLTPMEEAEGFARLIATGKYTADTLGQKLGKSRATIFARMKLMKLSKPLREALGAQEIDTSMAGLLAQVPNPEVQAKALKEVLKGTWDSDNQPMSFRQAKEHLAEHYTVALKEAPFNQEDTALNPKAGTCKACPKRSGNMKELFPDIGSPDVCTDVVCFNMKKEAVFNQKETAARQNGQTVLSAKEYDKVRYRSGMLKLDEQCWDIKGHPKYSDLLKKTDLKPMLARDGNELIAIAPRNDVITALKKAGVKLESGNSNSDYAKKERAEQQRKRAKRAVLTKVRELAAAAIVQKAAEESGREFWRLLARLAVETLDWDDAQAVVKRRAMPMTERQDANSLLLKLVKELKTENELRALAVEALATYGSVNQWRAEFEDTFTDACAHFKIDLKKLETQATPVKTLDQKTKKKK